MILFKMEIIEEPTFYVAHIDKTKQLRHKIELFDDKSIALKYKAFYHKNKKPLKIKIKQLNDIQLSTAICNGHRFYYSYFEVKGTIWNDFASRKIECQIKTFENNTLFTKGYPV